MPARRTLYNQKFILAFLSIAIIQFAFSKIPPGEKVIKSMWEKYHGRTSGTVLFTQKTLRYDSAGNLIKTSVWFEKIQFPSNFRIDVDSFPSASVYLWRNDSFYVIKNKQIVVARAEKNELLLLLGGMYHQTYKTVAASIKSLGYDLNYLRDSLIDGKPVHVIGRSGANQLWIEKETLRIKRIISEKNHLDAVIESWVKNKGGWMENKISFYDKGKLIQKEEYYDIETDVEFENCVFEPANISKGAK